jgi:O-antigen/teichoic acid export membrane protein
MASAVQELNLQRQTGAAHADLGLRRLMANILRKGTLAVTDQALFSGANFMVNVLLARWLAPAEYGAYSVAFAVFLLFASLHMAIVIEPMMVFGAGKYSSRFPRYLRAVFAGHLAVMAPASALLFATTLLLRKLYSPAVEQALRGLVFAAAAILLFWLVRRVFYVLLQPGWGAISGALYSVLLLGTVGLLKYTSNLSTQTAFLAMGVAGLVASVIVMIRFVPAWSSRTARPIFKEVCTDHWRYGRWALATALVGWFPGNVYYALLPMYLGLEGSGGLRALMNFVLPVLQAISALTMLLLPMLVRDRAQGGPKKMNRTMLMFLALFCGGAVVYLTGLWFFRDSVFQIFYGGKYSQFAGWPLFLTGLLPLATCASAVLGHALRALERPDAIFWCTAGSTLGAVLAGIPLSATLGVSGALLGLLASSVITVAMMGWFYWRALQEGSRESGAAL